MTSLLQLTQNLRIRDAFLLAQVDYSYTSQGKAPGPVFWICWLVVVVLMIAALWKMFAKAGQPGWAAVIPIVNTYFLIKIAGRPGWWLVLMFIPVVGFIIWIFFVSMWQRTSEKEQALESVCFFCRLFSS